MALSLAQMRESGDTGLPERTYRLCLAQKLVAEVGAIRNEIADLLDVAPLEDGPKRPARNADPNAARIAELNAKIAEIGERMDEHTGTLTIRALDAGEWRRWADAHPARTVGRNDAGDPITDPVDLTITSGWCNADDLLADLERFAVAWNGEPLGPGDWEFIASKAAPGDLSAICGEVIIAQVGPGVQIPKSQRPSPATPSDATD